MVVYLRAGRIDADRDVLPRRDAQMHGVTEDGLAGPDCHRLLPPVERELAQRVVEQGGLGLIYLQPNRGLDNGDALRAVEVAQPHADVVAGDRGAPDVADGEIAGDVMETF